MNFVKKQPTGQGLIEYAALIALLAISVLGALIATGTSLNDVYESVINAFEGAEATETPESTPEPLEDIIVTVNDQNGQPLANVAVLVFDGGNNYLNRRNTTDANGQARLSGLDPGTYNFRADFQRQDFWSNTINYPGQHEANIQIERFTITVNVVQKGSKVGVPNVPVYAFNEEGEYTAQTGTTGENGQTELQLVGDNYKFRADYNREAYWSETVNIPAASSVTIEVGLAQVTVRVADPLGNNIANVRVYAFRDNGSYLGMAGSTNQSGLIIFELENGSYKFRADYQGSTYWSDTITVPNSTAATITVGLDKLHISVTNRGGAPQSNVLVYVFAVRGRYYYWTSMNGSTDAHGNIYFDISGVNTDYRYQALAYDYYGLGRWRWSQVFNLPTTRTIQIRLP